MNTGTRRLLFLLFFVSGFSSLVYQVVWTRMAFASFGIVTPVLSVVLSVFMLGLAIGAWAAGRFVSLWVRRSGRSAIQFYAGAEALIGVGAYAVPRLFAAGEQFLLAAGQTNSFTYLSLSAVVLALAILPWCVCMGATFPLMMAFVREQDGGNKDSFSYLYLANVLGAMSGTFLTAVVLVEVLGFHYTLSTAAAGNFGVALLSGWLSSRQKDRAVVRAGEVAGIVEADSRPPPGDSQNSLFKWILFSTGFGAMAMEVVWTRAFTPILQTQVYAFASVIFVYLGATFLGSLWYRRDLRRGSLYSVAALMSFLAVSVFLPVAANDMRLFIKGIGGMDVFLNACILLGSICPLCGVLGYLTPCLIDGYAAGNPAMAGRAYALNVLGCILGPLVASYALLPYFSERNALIILSLPFLLFCFSCGKSLVRRQRWISAAAVVAVLGWSLFGAKDFEKFVRESSKSAVVRRDHAASVISTGEGQSKLLLVNGVGMTALTPITKFMVHLPMAFHQGRPDSVLIICFGMGTSHRSALSWDVATTTVELVPSVAAAFGFYHADAERALENPKGRIVIDDGRRFLKRTREKFDVIVIDPPPPVEAAGSSLLYSIEFYELAKQRLKPHGILQAWIPQADPATSVAVVRSLQEAFPYVRCFVSLEKWGAHFLAANEPIELRSAEELVARMPVGARNDLLEWSPTPDLTNYLRQVLSREETIEIMRRTAAEIRITDDQPYNEYFLLRHWKILSD